MFVGGGINHLKHGLLEGGDYVWIGWQDPVRAWNLNAPSWSIQ